MKQLFTTFMMMLAPLWAMAQTDYAPLLEEGKTWHYTYHNWATGKTYTFTEKLSGDSVVNGVTYMKYVSHDESAPDVLLREDGGKVYKYDSQKQAETLLYDFTMSVGECVFTQTNVGHTGGMMVSAVGKTDFGGKERKVLTICEWDGQWGDDVNIIHDLSQVWVEGMGSAGGLLTMYLPMPDNFIRLDSIETADGSVFGFEDLRFRWNANFARDGKVWNCQKDGVGYSYSLSGDTIIKAMLYQRVFEKNPVRYGDEGLHYYGAVRQNGKQVFFWEKDAEDDCLLYDFGVQEGETTQPDMCDDSYVVQDATITYAHDVARRFVSLVPATDAGSTSTLYCVEGIGSSTDPFRFDTEGTAVMLSCYEGGECMFTKEDFEHPEPSAILLTEKNERKDNRIFNLNGQQVKNPSRGVFVINGKKVMVK